MIRYLALGAAVLTAAACSNGDGQSGSVPAATTVVDDQGGFPFDPAISPDGMRLAWAQAVDGETRIHVGNMDGSGSRILSTGTWDTRPVWSPDGRWIAFAGESPNFDLYVVAVDSGAPRQLTSGPGFEVPEGWLPDGSAIVYSSAGAGDAQTYVIPVAGGPAEPLVATLGGNQYAMLSPDGAQVAIELQRGAERTLWVQDRAGGSARQLTTEGFEDGLPLRHAWSPDGRYLAYGSRRTGTWDLWIADVETGDLRQLTTDVRNDGNPRWSPDGRWIAFSSDRGGQWDVWIVAAAGGDAIRLTDDLDFESDFSWTPDGRTLYLTRSRSDGGIGVATPEDGVTRTLVAWPGYFVGSPELSPDGETVLFTSDRSGTTDIWSVPFAGGEPTPLAASPLNDVAPRFSPDGSQVVFVSNRAGSDDLWIVPAAGGDARRLTDWPSDEYDPRWSPDGTAIAFRSNRDATHHDVWVVPAEGGTPRRLTTFDADHAGTARWSRDGTALYGIVRVEGRAQGFRVAAEGGRPGRFTVSPDAGNIVGLSPDGSLMAYATFEEGWAFLELTPVAGGAPRRVTRRAERVFQPGAVWSPDGTRLAVVDWQYGDDPTTNIMELWIDDTTSRQVTSQPGSFESPGDYTSDGRQLVFSMSAQEAEIVSISVETLLAGR